MKVCIVCNQIAAFGKIGGYGSMARKLGRELVQRNVDVSVICRRQPGQQREEVLDGMRVIGLSARELLVSRARKIERFFSQPFFVAEAFTGFPGNYTRKDDTIRSFEEICQGKWDHLPEQAFMYVGAVEDAAEKAEKLAKS